MVAIRLLVILTLVAGVLALLSRRASELFLLSMKHGRLRLERGRIPPALFAAFDDIVRNARVESGTVRAFRGPSHARLVIHGVDGPTAQRFRNAFGIHPLRDLRAAADPREQDVRRAVGWAWLAWLLGRARRC